MNTPARNTDIRHIDTGLSAEEKRAAREEGLRQKQRRELGERYLCHPANAPRRGVYNPITGARLT